MNYTLGIIFILISSVFGAFGTLYFKLGASNKINLKNTKLMYAVGLSSISFVFYLYALKQAPLTFIYLTASVSYIWSIVLAKYVLKETINKYKVIGIIFLLVGITALNI